MTAAFGEAVEHIPLEERVLADSVPHSPTLGRLLKERRHDRLPIVGPVVVEMRRGVARVQQPLLGYTGLVHKLAPYGPGSGVLQHRRSHSFSTASLYHITTISTLFDHHILGDGGNKGAGLPCQSWYISATSSKRRAPESS